MESHNLDILKKIERVEVNEGLYHSIESRIEENRKNIIPLYIVGIVVSLVLGLMLSQVYFFGLSSKIKQSSNDFELVEFNNNSLYYE